MLFHEVDTILYCSCFVDERLYHVKDILLTEDFESANFIYSDYQRLADLVSSGFGRMVDFRLILREGVYADFETKNQTFKMEGV